MPIEGKQIFDKSVQDTIDKLEKSLINVNSQLSVIVNSGKKISGAKNMKELKTATSSLSEEQKKYIKTVETTIKIQNDLTKKSNKQKDADLLLAKAKIEQREAQKKLNEEAKKELGITDKKTSFTQKMAGAYKLALVQIVAVIGAMKGIVKFAGNVIASNQKLADSWAVFTGGLKTGMESVYRTIASGDFTFKELIKNFKDARKAGEEYISTLDAIGDRTNAQRIQEAERLGALSELEEITKDQTKSYKERIKAAKDFISIQEELNKGRIQLAKETYDAEVQIAMDESKLSEEQIIEYLKNYRKYEESEGVINSLLDSKSKAVAMRNDARLKLNLGQAKAMSRLIDVIDEQIAKEKELNKTYDGQNALTDERRKKLTDYYYAYLESQNNVYQENKKFYSLLSGLENQKAIQDEKLEKDKKEIRQNELDFYASLIETNEELDKQVLENGEKELNILDAIIQKDNEALNAKLSNIEIEANQYIKWLEKKAEAERFYEDLKKQTVESAIILTGSLLSRQEELTSRRYDNEIKKAQKAGKDTVKLEQDKARKIAEIQRKQAILNKAVALSQTVIDTQVTLGSISRTGGGTYYADFGISAGVLSALAIANGLARAAAIIAEPLPEIPRFFKGVKNYKGGIAMVGDPVPNSGKDYSTELVKLPNNKNIIVNEPTIMDLPKGSEVIPEKQLTKDLANFAIKKESNNLKLDLKGIERAVYLGVKKHPVIINKDGGYTSTIGNNRVEHINKRFRHV